MKVLCINDNWNAAPSEKHKPAPKFGDIETVIDHVLRFGTVFYVLEGKDSGFDASHFVPISEIDETEVAKQREHDFTKETQW